MAAQLLVSLLTIFIVGCSSEPAPGRVPKVYNALISSSQNLEPSKAYPVYQPVLQDAFAYSYQPLFYGGNVLGNDLLPAPAFPRGPLAPAPPPSPTPVPTSEISDSTPPSTETLPTTPEPPKNEPDDASSNSLTPPVTQSPIPLNEFGLPPQVMPLGPLHSVYNALPQFNPFAYRYPSVSYYNPYDPFSFNPYASLPSIYRPAANVLEPNYPGFSNKPVAVASPPQNSETPISTPPPEPSDLSILNYSATDPAIPNVPPPPLPQGGLKSGKSE